MVIYYKINKYFKLDPMVNVDYPMFKIFPLLGTSYILVEELLVISESFYYFVFRLYTGAFVAFHHICSFFHLKQEMTSENINQPFVTKSSRTYKHVFLCGVFDILFKIIMYIFVAICFDTENMTCTCMMWNVIQFVTLFFVSSTLNFSVYCQ